LNSLLTPTRVKRQVETDLSDSTLQEILDREEAEIVRRFGPHSDGTSSSKQTLLLPGLTRDVFVPRPFVTVISVREAFTVGDLATATVLTANTDYVAWAEEGRIERLGALFTTYVQVEYVPIDDRDERRRVLVELCRLTTNNQALERESFGGGEYSYVRGKYEDERSKLLSQLAHFVPL